MPSGRGFKGTCDEGARGWKNGFEPARGGVPSDECGCRGGAGTSERKNGVLPFNDRVEPEIIRREFNLSKNAFKRAVGHLLKEGKVEVNEDSIRLK